jgi:hypothetical protein
MIARCTYTIEWDLDDPGGLCHKLGIRTEVQLRQLLADEIADGAFIPNADDFEIEIVPVRVGGLLYVDEE